MRLVISIITVIVGSFLTSKVIENIKEYIKKKLPSHSKNDTFHTTSNKPLLKKYNLSTEVGAPLKNV